MALTVKALREELAQLPAEANEWPVVLAKDAEGNAFSPLEEAAAGYYEPATPTAGDWTDSMPRRADNAVCLWPLR